MKILFIGNSHTYFNDMPYMFAELMRASGTEVEITMLTRGGQTIKGHIANEQTRFNILYGNYDYVILQENTSKFPDAKTYTDDVSVILGWCKKAGVPLGLYMNFEAPKDTPSLEYLRNGVLSAAETLSLPVARVGEAFAKAKEELPHLYLYHTDHHHANAFGSYLIALTVAHGIFGADVFGLPSVISYKGDTLVSLSSDDASVLQKIAQSL
jgi:hypothetical protein